MAQFNNVNELDIKSLQYQEKLIGKPFVTAFQENLPQIKKKET